jgi:hypothetical protein
VRLWHSWSKATVSFDEDNLVSCAGLVPAMDLAEQAGLSDLVSEHVKITDPPIASTGANPAAKITSIVAGMACAGRKVGYRFWPGLSRSRSVFVEQSAEVLSASDRVDPGRERDRVRVVVGSTQNHPGALVAAPGVVVGNIDVEHVA